MVAAEGDEKTGDVSRNFRSLRQ